MINSKEHQVTFYWGRKKRGKREEVRRKARGRKKGGGKERRKMHVRTVPNYPWARKIKKAI